MAGGEGSLAEVARSPLPVFHAAIDREPAELNPRLESRTGSVRLGCDPGGRDHTEGVSPRHVPASVTELSRIGLLSSLPGERLNTLAGRMQREAPAPGPR